MRFSTGRFSLALALIGRQLQCNKLNFAALFCCFCENTSFFSVHLIFVLEQTFSIPEIILVFSGIVLPSTYQKLPGESAETRILGGKVTKEHIARKKFLFPLIKLPLKKYCQDRLLKQTLSIPESVPFVLLLVLPSQRNNRKNFL